MMMKQKSEGRLKSFVLTAAPFTLDVGFEGRRRTTNKNTTGPSPGHTVVCRRGSINKRNLKKGRKNRTFLARSYHGTLAKWVGRPARAIGADDR
jgi:hypothetical protein